VLQEDQLLIRCVKQSNRLSIRSSRHGSGCARPFSLIGALPVSTFPATP